MKKLIAAVAVFTVFTGSALAQSGGVPPSQPATATGDPLKLKKGGDTATPKAETTAASDAKPVPTGDKKAARKAKRAAKVGDKPIN